MTTRLDLTLQKHPEHEEGIRLLASRDPSGNLKYLDWGAKMLASGQALAKEIADVLELFHQFGGHGRRRRRYAIRSDIYTYRPQDLASLRDALLKLKRARDRKQKKRERLYRIEGAVEADVVYDSTDLIVRHIKNKEASVHYGLGTKWCISMLREGYFEEYESHNATFFFFERKARMGDEFDKVALMVPRNGGEVEVEAFTAIDRRVDMMTLAKAHGTRVFDIFREVYERSERFPGSAVFHVYQGSATQEQIESVIAIVAKGDLDPYEAESILESICCNDAAPWPLLKGIRAGASALSMTARKRTGLRRRHRRHDAGELMRTILAALVIHPATPADIREKLVKELRRRHVKIGEIHRTNRNGRAGVSYQAPVRTRGRLIYRHAHLRRRQLRRTNTLIALRAQAQRFDRAAATTRKKIKKKIADEAKKKLRKRKAK